MIATILSLIALVLVGIWITLSDLRDVLKEACCDWSARREVAKDILCAILSTKTTAGDSDIATAIEIADELIKQLNEERK